MNIGIIGGGGRENALGWKIVYDLANAANSEPSEIFAIPGNPGMAKYATCVPDISVSDIGAIVGFARAEQLDLVVIGPEGPLGLGLVDALTDAGIPAFGPTQQQAQIELSKVFFRELAEEFDIPIAKGTICEHVEEALAVAEEAFSTAQNEGFSLVVKPDGATGGKGVMICHTYEEAEQHIRAIMEEHIYQSTGDTGERVVLEECLVGREASYTAIACNGRYLELATAEDHKPRFDGDKGKMTGGMGAYSPSAIADAHLETIRRTIVQPLIDGLNKRCGGYKGVLYIALMITEDGPKVLEVNARFGDPETQVLVDRLESPLLPILMAVAAGEFPEDITLEWSEDVSLGMTLVSASYPDSCLTGQEITGIELAESKDAMFYHAGTATENGKLVVSSGRVGTVVCRGETVEDANEQALTAGACIMFEEIDYRKDIGLRPNMPELLQV